MSIVIRPADPTDVTAIKDCAVAAYASYVPVIGKKPAPMVADYASLVADGQVWVATDGLSLAGFVVFFPKDRAMFLENVAVHPGFSGRGFGKRLIAFCETAATSSGFDRVTLYTNEKMTANLALYARLGYRQTARRREGGFNRIYFEKQL